MRIWARLLIDTKIQKDLLYTYTKLQSFANFEVCVREICHSLDVPTPIILPHHFRNFNNFHNAKFKGNDFVEPLDYDILIIEDCKEQ